MQNKNSNLNTILLIILIILLGITIYFLNSNRKTVEFLKESAVQNNGQLETSNTIEKEGTSTTAQEDNKASKTVETKSSSKATSNPVLFLKSFLEKSLSVSIDECTYSGTTYFGVSYSDVADGSTSFYTLNATKPNASCGGYMPIGSIEDPICRSISNSCKTVYRSQPGNPSGAPSIDFYGLK
jgi:hypothetical protein